MNSPKCRTIMVVDDDLIERNMLRYILEEEGYRCIEVQDEEIAVDLAQFHQPDLIIMDRMMPRRNGLEISIELKRRLSVAQIPIIMVTADDRVEDKVEALEDGVDDYVCKPYEPRELIARVKAMLRSSKDAIDRNPTTLLPGATALEEEIVRYLRDDRVFALMHADLDNFKPYADSHGFSLANEVIKNSGRLMSQTVEAAASPISFVAHIGGDDYIIIVTPEKAQEVAAGIITSFDTEISRYFSEREVAQGFYIGKDRDGRETQFPIMTISIGIITNKYKKYHTPTDMGVALSVAKRKAKTMEKSSYFCSDCLPEKA
ncbi:MAG: response regulator [Candidatus Xenobiia bacterium LiM19]